METYEEFRSEVEVELARINEVGFPPQDHDWQIELAYDMGLTVDQAVSEIVEDLASFTRLVTRNKFAWGG